MFHRVPALLDEVKMTPWFHGTLSRPESERTLTGHSAIPGSALFRESRGLVVLSVYLHGNFYSHHVLKRETATADLEVDDKPVAGCHSATQLVALLREPSSIVTVPLFMMLAGPPSAICPAWLCGAKTVGEIESRLHASSHSVGGFLVRDGPAPGTFVLSFTNRGKVIHKEIDFLPAVSGGCSVDGRATQCARPLTSITMVVHYLQGNPDPVLPIQLFSPA